MLIADSHEFIEVYRGARDLRLGMELVRLRGDVRFVSFAPDVLSPSDVAVTGAKRLADVALPPLPEGMELRTLPGRVVRFARKEAGGKFSLMAGYGRALAAARPDAVIESVYSWLTPRSYTTHRVARRLGVPLVYYDPGDDVALTAPQRLMAPFERGVVRDVDAIVTYNAAGRRRFASKYGYPADRIRVIPKPVDVAEWRPPVSLEQARASLGLPPEAFIVAYTGRLARVKGSRTLAEVARRAAADPALAHWRFLFVGDTLDSAEDARDYAMPNTRLTGMIPNAEVPAVLAAADVVAFPDVAHPGGFWTSIAETMAAAKPIVLGAPPDQDFVPVADGESALLVPPADDEALLAALRRLEAEPALRARLAGNVGRFAEERMDYPRVAASWLTLLDDAVAQRAEARALPEAVRASA